MAAEKIPGEKEEVAKSFWSELSIGKLLFQLFTVVGWAKVKSIKFLVPEE